MKPSPEQIAQQVKQRRKEMKLSQKNLAKGSRTGRRFIVELEQGKPTCQIGKICAVMDTLGLAFGFSNRNTKTQPQPLPAPKSIRSYDSDSGLEDGFLD